MTATPAAAAEPLLGELAARLAAVAVANLGREFPYAPAHVMTGPDDHELPRERHPAFFGAYDWHSAVHMHWLLVRLLRRHGDRIDATAIRAVLDAHLAPQPMAAEAVYLRAHPGWERPYGWAGLARLAAECADWSAEAAEEAEPAALRWSQALRPAAAAVAALVLDWLPRAGHPVRHGTHANSAFALGLLLDASVALEQDALHDAVEATARGWFLRDRDAPAVWEPSGEDFLSPSLVEADLVRRLLPGPEFADWLTGFLPTLGTGGPPALLEPVTVTDDRDGQIGHLLGLNLSRAAALRSIAGSLPAADARVPVLRSAARRQVAVALPAVVGGDYLSEHWLGTYAVLALDTAD
jgi:hypothetical protein